MKNLLFIAIAVVSLFTACNGDSKSTKETSSDTTKTPEVLTPEPEQLYACSMHPEVVGKKGDKCPKCNMDLSVPVKSGASVTQPGTTIPGSTATPADFSIKEIVSNYLTLKNALTKDDSKAAATAGKAFVSSLATLDANKLPDAQKNAFTDVAEDAKEHAEHIGDNAGKLDHQREHFAMLSKDVSDLVQTFGTEQKLYQDFCPMFNDNKGAIWISETKEIKNPYYGSKMLTCGSLKKEL